MKRFIEGEDRQQVTMLPECLDDYIAEDNPVRVVDVFVEELDLRALGFDGINPAVTGRPAYHPAVLLKLYIYGYLNRIQSSRRLEREAQRNVELMWLTGRLAPDFKTIADFRRSNGTGIRNVCKRFIAMCRQLNLFSQAIVAIDGSKFKAVNSRDRNFTTGNSHSFGGTYLDLVFGEKLVYSDVFDDPAMPGEMMVTVTLKAVSVGTELRVEQTGIPDVIPVEACYLGWQQSLRKLAKLVEPEIGQ